jgi:hypothetical protein
MRNYIRLAADVPWTGRLRHLLGGDHDIVEDGLSGRTTDVDQDDRVGANGRTYFRPSCRHTTRSMSPSSCSGPTI